MNSEIDLSPLARALDLLDRALGQPKGEYIRDACIQRFEYTYELSWKMLRRVLMADMGADTISAMARRDLFRVAAEQQLIADPVAWFGYQRARNETSHTYDEKRADEIYEVAQAFASDARSLLNALTRYQ